MARACAWGGRQGVAGPVPDPDRVCAQPSHQGSDDDRREPASVRLGVHPFHDETAVPPPHRSGHLPGRLLSHQSQTHSGDLPAPVRTVWRLRPGLDRGTPDPSRRGTEDGQPRGHGGVREAGDLRGHPCAPHQQSVGVRQDEDPRGNRAGLAPEAAAPVLDHVQ